LGRPDRFGAWGTAWLDELPPPQPYGWKVASLRQLTGWLSAEITVLEQVTADLLAGHDAYRAVQELPGIGPVLGAVIVAEIGDVTRFRHPARLCSWAGLTPRHYESDTTVVRGRITKRHHRPPRPPGAQHRQGRRGPQAAHLRLLRDARRARQGAGHPRRTSTGDRMSRPGRGQCVIASVSGPAPRGGRPPD